MSKVAADDRYPLDLGSLPHGWAAAPVGEVTDGIRPGFASGEHNRDTNGVPHLRPMNIDRAGRIDLSDVKYVAGHNPLRLSMGDVLFNNTNSPELVGKTAPIYSSDELAYSNHMTRLRPTEGMSCRFMALQLHYLWMSGYFRYRCAKHVNQASISSSVLAQTVPLLVAPTNEQDRIVAEVEKQFSRLDAGLAALKRVEANLRRYKAAVLKAACDGSLSAPWRAAHADVEPAEKLLARILRERRRRWEEAELAKLVAKGKPPKDDRWKQRYKEPAAPRTAGLAELPPTWCWATVEQLMWDGQYGTSIKCDYDASGVPVLRIPNIVNEQVDLADLKFATGAVQGWPECKLVPGDILVCRTNGSIDLLGKSAVISAGFEGDYAFASYLIRLRLVWGDPIARYVHLVFGSRWGRQLIEGNAASSAGQHNLSLSKIARFPVPLPPIDEMQHIVGSLDECLSTASATAQAVAVNLKRADRLRQAILKAAFEGRLVAQDPSDEPAAALLERIRADRDAGKRRTARRTRPRRRVPHG